ncbi:MAG: protease modulator HflC, partial [Clostridia bacterium]|nr:protease modulator HflC [Clostridia bacterium]
MKKLTGKILIAVLLVVAAITLLSGAYTVGENEYACVVRFEKIMSTTDQAGLHFKVPFLEGVKKFPKAVMFYDIPPSEVFTSDKQNMTADSYVLW